VISLCPGCYAKVERTKMSTILKPNCEAWRVQVAELIDVVIENALLIATEMVISERLANLTPIGSSFIVEVADAEGNCWT
jgi:hypothetical protein